MMIDQLVEGIKNKKNPCIVGIDPEWCKIPECYKYDSTTKVNAILDWATDVIDAVADIVPAVKPQLAFLKSLVQMVCEYISKLCSMLMIRDLL